MEKRRFSLGQLLIERKIITQSQLDEALEEQKKTGELLGATLLRMGFIKEETVFLPLLAGQFEVDHINLNEIEIPDNVIRQVPAKIASHYKIIPFGFEEGTLLVATNHPLDVHMLDEISLVVKSPMRTALASEKDIAEAIRKYYGVGAETIEKMMDSVSSDSQERSSVDHIDELGSDASISKFLNQILLEAYQNRATDVHIEPFEDELSIRYRVDGILHDANVPPNIKHFKDAINARIKILSNLNIAEKRMPQDGKFKVRVNDVDIDLRVSFLPTPYGESVVLRVLSSTTLFSLEDLGLPEEALDLLQGLIKKPHGIIFLTGPTGSGKTTTLYSCLHSINTENVKIITIEDPIEYQLKGITQIQINPKVGLTFAQGLRSMLRHDPDIMMVGEVRDIETAEIATQVALTGHLVFSTLHTNDAATGIARLLDMGVEPYLITSTVECLIAQRLVRVLCPSCKQRISRDDEVLKDFYNQVKNNPLADIYEAKGCEECQLTGYIGREAIYEFLVFNEEIRQLIMSRETANIIKDAALRQGMKTLYQAGWEKVAEGITSPQEVLRVTQEEAE
jgi:type II secretion system protein E